MMKRFVKKLCFTIASVLVMLIGTAAICTASSETLRVLEWGAYLPQEHQQKFVSLVKEKYGVDLKFEITGVKDNDDFFPALRDKKADIISPSHNVPKNERFNLIGHKLVLPLNMDNIPNYKNVIPALQKPDYCTEADKIYGTPIARGPYGLAYNTAIITEPPDSWNIFWDPKFKGKYTVGNLYQQNVNITALAMGITAEDISDYTKVNTPEFIEKLTYLAVNARSVWEGVDKPEDLKGLSLAASWGSGIPGLKEMGEVWKIAEPKEGTTAWIDNLMISYTLEDKPKLRQIAEEWLNYVLSDDYQMYIVRGAWWMPVTATISNRLTPEEIERFHLNDPTHFEKHRILWKSLGKRDRQGLERLWEKALKERK